MENKRLVAHYQAVLKDAEEQLQIHKLEIAKLGGGNVWSMGKHGESQLRYATDYRHLIELLRARISKIQEM